MGCIDTAYLKGEIRIYQKQRAGFSPLAVFVCKSLFFYHGICDKIKGGVIFCLCISTDPSEVYCDQSKHFVRVKGP